MPLGIENIGLVKAHHFGPILWSPLGCPHTIIARLKRGTYISKLMFQPLFFGCCKVPKAFFSLQTEVVMCFIMVLASQLWFFHPLVNTWVEWFYQWPPPSSSSSSAHNAKDLKKKTLKLGEWIQICKVLKKGRKLDESLMKSPCQGCWHK